MNSVPFSEARAHLTDIVNKVNYRGKRFILTKNGKNVAVLVSMEDLEMLEKLEEHLDIKAAKRARSRRKKEGTVSLKKAKQELNL